jgi:hypothetical protein
VGCGIYNSWLVLNYRTSAGRDATILLQAFLLLCCDCKGRMMRDVTEQLQRISGQQSKIRDMKNKLAAFGEVLQRQLDAFAELRHVHKLPAAYRLASK